MCVNARELSPRYRCLDSEGVVISRQEFEKQYPDFSIDLFIVTDTNALERIGPKMQLLASKAKDLLFIDHHPCPPELQAIHCINTEMSATGELISILIESLGIPFDQKLALPLYTSILIDTSSFRYPSVTPDTHRIIAKLLDTGIDIPSAYNNIYGTQKIGHIHLLGKILSSARCNSQGNIAWLVLKQKDLEEFGIDTEDTLGFINHLLILHNIRVACMFTEMPDSIKVSLRSLGEVDVGVMARGLGGGGHGHSAATILKQGDLERTVAETLEKLEAMLSNKPKQ